ncbi:hypothetical protein Tco_1111984, partial [Tanacetum coccineum]
MVHADELHKFSDGAHDDVRTALNDIAKGIRMEYLPKRKWSGLDNEGRGLWFRISTSSVYVEEERISKKRTKNEAKTTKPDTEWKSMEQIQAHMDKEEQIKKAAEEAKIFEITKIEVIKVVQEEAEKIGLDPKTIKKCKS